jgi:GMC oxidoreductase/putative NAD(P)-binding protein
MSSSCTPDVVHPWLHDTVSALVYSLAESHAGSDGAELQPPYNDLTAFVLQQQAQLPDYLRAPMRLALCGFDLLGFLRTGRLFHSRPATVRARQIAAWKNSSLALQRDLIRYCESLAAFGLFSRPSLPARSAAAAAGDTPSPGVLENPPPDLRCEIAVVGSGPGGAITACLLAEAGRDVLLIEEGPFLPLESCTPFSLEEMLQKYRNGGQTVALGKDKLAYVEGRCVGGGSEINSGLYHRTPPEVLEQWRKQFNVQGLTEAELLPFFEANEGELSVSLLAGPPPAASLKLHEGAARLGWKSLEVPRWFRHNGSATGGERQSMTRTFVP